MDNWPTMSDRIKTFQEENIGEYLQYWGRKYFLAQKGNILTTRKTMLGAPRWCLG
jgi:hypothetical protein